MKTGLLTLVLLIFFGGLGFYSVSVKNAEQEKVISERRAALTHSLNKGTELEIVSAYKNLIAVLPDDYELLTDYITYCEENGFDGEYVEACYSALALNPEDDFAPNKLVDYMIQKHDRGVYSFIKQCLDTLPEEKSGYIKGVYDSIKGAYMIMGDTFSEVCPFSATGYTYGEKYTIIGEDSVDDSAAAKNDFSVSVVDSMGKTVKSFSEYPMSYSAGGRSFAMIDELGVPAYYNIDGRKTSVPYSVENESTIPFKYLGEFSENVSNAADENGKWGWMTGVLQFFSTEYDYTSPFLNGVAYGRKGNEYTFVNKQLEPLLSGTFDGIMEDQYGFCTDGNVIYLKKSGKYEMYYITKDAEGKIVIESTGATFDDVKPFGKELGAVCVNGKWGFADKTGALIVEPQFNDAYSFGAGLAPVESGGSWGYIDNEYDSKKANDDSVSFVINPVFESAYPFNTRGVAPVKIGGMWSFIELVEYASS